MANSTLGRDAFLRYALAYPDSHVESPWGGRVVKVRKKVFVFSFSSDDSWSCSLKLPHSRVVALEAPNAQPMNYGMGRHGWVSFSFEVGTELPLDTMLEYLHESFCAVAPKSLVKGVGVAPIGSPAPVPEPVPQGLPGSVLLIGDDPLRLERAARGLAAAGTGSDSASLADALDAAGALGPDCVLLDLSRNASKALALVGELGVMCHGARFVIAGARDAKMVAEVSLVAPDAEVSREAPGDPTLVALLQ